MQSRRWWQHHGSSGELDVFGATRYFAGRAVDCATAVAHDPAAAGDRLPESFRGHAVEQLVGVHDLGQEKEMEVELAKPKPSGDEPVKASSLSSATPASRRSTDEIISAGLSAVADDDDDVQVDGLDLGVATGDRRLQGVKVVIRSTRSGANQETWVVRCSTSCWDDPHRSFDGAVSGNNCYVDDHQVEEGEEDSTTTTTDPHRNYHWNSDSSSDLFDLDIETSVDLL